MELLVKYKDTYKRKEKYKFYTLGYKLPAGAAIKISGYYISVNDEVYPINISLEKYEREYKGRHRIISGGHDLDRKPPTKDTMVYTRYITTRVFCENGIFKQIIFSNVSRDSIDRYMNLFHKDICTMGDGKDFYRISGNNIDTEIYNKYRGVSYYKSYLNEDTLYYGSYTPEQSGRSGQVYVPYKNNL